jgi:hypothetical protein
VSGKRAAQRDPIVERKLGSINFVGQNDIG